MASVEEALREIRTGRMVVVVDDENRENEGDLLMAAGKVTARDVTFMATHGRGLICVPVAAERLRKAGIEKAPSRNRGDAFSTAFTYSVDAAKGITTGISAADRARTIKLFAQDALSPSSFVSPGHIFPLEAREGGVLVRAGHTEAAVDLARLAGLAPAGVICEIMKDDGTMARLPYLKGFAKRHGMLLVSIADIIAYRRKTERLVECAEEVSMPTEFGEFRLRVYVSRTDGKEHVALFCGNLAKPPHGKAPLVRVHSECLTGDVFGSLRCDCGHQIRSALARIAKEGCGALLYMRQEGRGIGLTNKMHAYKLQEKGLDTVEANVKLGFAPDLRDYGTGAQILADLGLKRIRLITNNPQKVIGLKGHGLEIAERLAAPAPASPHSRRYLKTKKEKMGHWL
ncbi:MAG: bifunctional 3,4-dihydroxy-2-butanone-4-phosphate synthase/GTP cyclohydrolase II [Kiritimatiellaeota bacterium]|nr:bifunctional 3,4-dihydroxy-2-butanone-4-phosphate synthase/GTP cyclohydrolase II [Kiritimatiellota bacterium]